MELWKDIPGYGNLYQASSLGKIKSKSRTVTKATRWGGLMNQKYPEKILFPSSNRLGYYGVHIGFNGEDFYESVHRLVLYYRVYR